MNIKEPIVLGGIIPGIILTIILLALGVPLIYSILSLIISVVIVTIIDRNQKKQSADIQKSTTGKPWIIPGIVLIVVAGCVFLIPANDFGMSLSDISNLCKSPFGLLGQAFAGQDGQKTCVLANTIVSLATVMGIAGIVLIAIGIVKRKK